MSYTQIDDKILIDDTIAGQSIDEWKSFSKSSAYSYINDQQGQAYSNMVSFDLTSAISQNGFMALESSFLLMPFSTILSSTVITSGLPILNQTVALKNNFINFVDSVQLWVDGVQLIDATNYSNFPIQILDALTMSADDLKLVGSALNISPDTPTSIRFPGTTATTSGDGIVNNVYLNNAAATTLTSTDYSLMNNGLAQRNLNTFLDPSLSANYTAGTITSYPTPLAGTSGGICPTATLQNYFSSGTTSTSTASAAWNYIVYLPLRKLGDIFCKLPLLKGGQIRIQVNFNASVSVFNVTTATSGLMKMTSNVQTAGNTTPHMVTNSLINLLSGTGSTSAFTLTTAVQAKTQAKSGTAPQLGFSLLPQCRIYVKNVVVNPNFEERILSNRVQKIRYYDWYQYPILKTSTGAPYSATLSTAIINPQLLIVIPFQNGASGLFNSFTGNQFNSVFDTAPATSLPGAMGAFTNCNVTLSGVSLWQQNQNYIYDNWAQEVNKLGLNAGLSKELASGLVGLNEWAWSPYLIADLSRRSPEQDRTYQSITLFGNNASGVTIDLYCFVLYEKQITVDVLTGRVSRDY